MILGRVTGELVSTIRHAVCDGRRMMVVERVNAAGRETGQYLVAFDAVDAGVGQTVLVIDEGNSARQVIGQSSAPIRSIIIGIVDEVDVSC
jgi:ethanolamine utilization protein EutN